MKKILDSGGIAFSNSGGAAMYVLLLVIILGAFFMVGGNAVYKLSLPPNNTVTTSSFACCDTGNGADCKPQTGTGQTFSFPGSSGSEYGLLKTGITFSEGIYHLKDSGEKFNGNPIVLNSSNDYGMGECGGGHDDQIYGGPTGCFAIPNDEIIYVCTKNCESTNVQQYCNQTIPGEGVVSCFGNQNSQFDVYFKQSDYPNPGIPTPIKDCDKGASGAAPAAGGPPLQAIIVPTTDPHNNLQLQSFKIIQTTAQTSPWVSPYCKPAVYLYPEKETQVSVQVNPVGPFTYTDPLYPQDGWLVTAKPDGEIISNKKTFPYLFYEADIPSLLVEKPKTGYVVEGLQITSFLRNLLPKLSLNSAETNAMVTYWQKALPKSPYYFIGIIPQQTLDSIAPLTINPTPDNVIRVGLYFEPLENKTEVQNPIIQEKSRGGFTVVEWGGMVHSNKPFTCLQ